MSEKLLTIIIVNWNSRYHLRNCVNSILKYHSKTLDQVIIVDNNSNDNSIDFLKYLQHEKLFLIKNKINLGFSKACNQGALLAKNYSKYLLFLNPDTIISKNILDKSVYFLEENKSSDIGIFGVALTNNKKITKTCRRFPTLKTLFADISGISKINKKTGWEMLEWDHKSSKRVDQLIGAYYLIRKNLFENLNGFDERFFVYSEEVDLSYRAKKNGYSSYFCHKLKCIHYGGGCTESIKSKRLYLSIFGRILYFRKHLNFFKFLIALFLILVIEPMSRLLFLILNFRVFKIINLINAYKKLYKKLIEKNFLFFEI